MTDRDPSLALQSLLQTMARLRGPDGCPWDAAQTPQTLAPYILEEACELVDALEDGQERLIRDELGDLLLQVVFQAQIFAERASFDFADIAAAINAKLIRRHPHVFGDTGQPDTEAELDRQWEQIKQSEPSALPADRLADQLPSRLPSLQRAQKLAVKLRRAGRIDDLLDTLAAYSDRETGSAEQSEPGSGNPPASAAGIARELMRLVLAAEEAAVDAEGALRQLIRELAEDLSPARNGQRRDLTSACPTDQVTTPKNQKP